MPMTLTERERGYGASLLDLLTRPFSFTRQSIEGPARLIFTDGRSCPVMANVELYRSSLSASGEGYLNCPAEFGFEALHSSEWLTLKFDCGATIEIEVNDVKARDDQCRCRFEVKS